MNTNVIVEHLRKTLPELMAIYVFGSRAQNTATATSDLDLAVLVQGLADPLQLFNTAGELADIAGCPVDLVDLRATSTIMQYQIVTTGERIWECGSDAAIYESFILSEKTSLDEARAGLISDIEKSGRIYGR